MSNPYASPQNEADVDLSEAIAGNVRGLQVITAAMAQGSIAVLVITLFINRGEVNGTPEILSWIGIGVAALMFVLHLVVPQIMLQASLRKINKTEYLNSTLDKRAQIVLGAIRGPHIVACAMLEGATFLSLIGYLTEEWIGNLIVAGILIALILMKFPTKTSMSFKVQDRMREIEMG